MAQKHRVVVIVAVVIFFVFLISGLVSVDGQQAAGQSQHETYLPLTARDYFVSGEIVLNEVMPRPDDGDTAWVELYNPTIYPVDIAGWQVTDGDGNSYTIPDELPRVPGGSFVVIYFDGQGAAANDYDFSDDVAELHTPSGQIDIFDAEADQVAVYYGTPSAGTIVDFVAYGDLDGVATEHAVEAGIWRAARAVSFHVGSGAVAADAPVETNQSIGVYADRLAKSRDDWVVYRGEDLTPGAENVVPRPYWSTVGDEVTMGSDGFALGWSLLPGATYQLQIDDNENFDSPLVDVTLDFPFYVPEAPLPGGNYVWRVRNIDSEGNYSEWSATRRVNVITVISQLAAGRQPNAASQVVSERVLGMTWLRQRKDTLLACIDGDREGDPATNGIEEAWDAIHPDGIFTHGRNNCVRASIAMIVTNYRGNLSQDRLSYELFERGGDPVDNRGGIGSPDIDLGHDQDTFCCGSDGSHAMTLLAWALGMDASRIDYGRNKPSFGQIKNWIDDGRPIMRWNAGHVTVIGGYRELANGIEQVHLFDPWSGRSWLNYNTVAIGCWYVPPASAPNVRSDEPGIWTDSDSDGLQDWDETVRWHTNPANPDTDGDGQPDKIDIREYVFDNSGNYNLRPANIDGDDWRKECDSDNDNGGAMDGEEDWVNFNGKYESGLGETDNFSGNDDMLDCVEEDPYEDNNNFSEAEEVGLGSELEGYICPVGDEDFFKVHRILLGTIVRLELTNLPADYDLYLYNDDHQEVAKSTNVGTNQEVIDYQVTDLGHFAGDFYVKIAANDGSRADNPDCRPHNLRSGRKPYRLRITETQEPFPNVRVSRDLTLSKSTAAPGESVTARFTVHNYGTGLLSADQLAAGGRGPEDTIQDYPWESQVVIYPNDDHTYEATRSFEQPGHYRFEVVYQDTNGDWHTIPPDPGVSNSAALDVVQSQCASDAYEPNNDFEHAAPMEMDTTYQGYLCPDTDVDYFDLGSMLLGDTISVLLTNLPADYDLYLYDRDHAEVARSAYAGTGDESVSYTHVRSFGTDLYAKAVGRNGAWNGDEPYDLTAVECIDEYEPNETWEDAADVDVTSGETTRVRGWICSGMDVDYFSFGLESSQCLGQTTIKLSRLWADYNLYLYDDNHREIGHSESPGMRMERIREELRPGEYYVGIRGADQSQYNTERRKYYELEIEPEADYGAIRGRFVFCQAQIQQEPQCPPFALLFDRDRLVDSVEIDDDGSFEFNQVPPGDNYHIEHACFTGRYGPITVRCGQTTDVGQLVICP